MEYIELKNSPEIKRIILAGFSGYRKTKAGLDSFPEHGLNINSYWDGGSRSEYAIVELATMQRKSLPTNTHPYFDIARRGLANGESNAISTDHVGNVTLNILPEGFALVQAGTFCGKAAIARVYLNPANITPLLTGVTA